MKIKLGMFLVCVLALASGCARKCPPCPISNNMGTTGSYSTTSSFATAAPAPAATASDTTSQYGAESARYVRK